MAFYNYILLAITCHLTQRLHDESTHKTIIFAPNLDKNVIFHANKHTILMITLSSPHKAGMQTCDNSVCVDKIIISIIIGLLMHIESFTSEESQVQGLPLISGGMSVYRVLFLAVA